MLIKRVEEEICFHWPMVKYEMSINLCQNIKFVLTKLNLLNKKTLNYDFLLIRV